MGIREVGRYQFPFSLVITLNGKEKSMALTLKVPFLLFYIVYVLYILDFLVVFILYISVRCPIRATQIHRYLFSVTFIADSQLVCADLLGLEAYS